MMVPYLLQWRQVQRESVSLCAGLAVLAQSNLDVTKIFGQTLRNLSCSRTSSITGPVPGFLLYSSCYE